jgi:hypothetical protein
MKINPDFASPCGLYCGVCAIYFAHRDNSERYSESYYNSVETPLAATRRLVDIYSLAPMRHKKKEVKWQIMSPAAGNGSIR